MHFSTILAVFAVAAVAVPAPKPKPEGLGYSYKDASSIQKQLFPSKSLTWCSLKTLLLRSARVLVTATKTSKTLLLRSARVLAIATKTSKMLLLRSVRVLATATKTSKMLLLRSARVLAIATKMYSLVENIFRASLTLCVVRRGPRVLKWLQVRLLGQRQLKAEKWIHRYT